MKAHNILHMVAYFLYGAAIISFCLAIGLLFAPIPEEQYQQYQQGLGVFKLSLSLGMFGFSFSVFMTGVWTAAFADIARNTFDIKKQLDSRQKRRSKKERQSMDYEFD